MSSAFSGLSGFLGWTVPILKPRVLATSVTVGQMGAGARQRAVAMICCSVPWVFQRCFRSTWRSVILPLGWMTQMSNVCSLPRCLPRNLKLSSGTIAYSTMVVFCCFAILRIWARLTGGRAGVLVVRWARSSAKARARPCSEASRANSGFLAAIRTCWRRL
jgi:hypothetical protein